MKVHLVRGQVHLLRALALGMAWLVLGWALLQLGPFGMFLRDVLYLPFVLGGLLICWRDIASGTDKGLMVGLLYAAIFAIIAIVFEGLLGFGTPPFFSNPFRQMFGTIIGESGLGDLVQSFWSSFFGWPGVWGQLIGLTLFGGVFAYVKDKVAK